MQALKALHILLSALEDGSFLELLYKQRWVIILIIIVLYYLYYYLCKYTYLEKIQSLQTLHTFLFKGLRKG